MQIISLSTENIKIHLLVHLGKPILLNYVVGWQSHSFLAGLLRHLAKNMFLLVQHFLGLPLQGYFAIA